MTRAALAAALALAALSCAHNPSQLTDALRLEVRLASQRQRAHAPFEARFALRNTASEPVVFCQMDSGVSIAVRRRNDPDAHPIVLHGLALNPAERCHERVSLAPGAAKEFRETLRVREDLAGPGHLLAQIRVHLPGPLRREADIVTVRAPALPIFVQGTAPAEKSARIIPGRKRHGDEEKGEVEVQGQAQEDRS